MDIQMTVAAIHQQREQDARKIVLASQARGDGLRVHDRHAWHTVDPDVTLAARLRWLLHLPAAPAADRGAVGQVG